MRKPAFCISENKGALQVRSNCAADQCLRFRHIDSTIPVLPKSEISSLWPSSVAVKPVLCRTWSETPKTGFLATPLIKSFKPHISDHSKVVLLIWFAVLLVLVSVSVLFSPSMHLDDI